MTPTTLTLWLEEQIAAEERTYLPWLLSPRRNGKNTARDRLAHCQAQRELLRLHHLVYDEEWDGLYCAGCGFDIAGRPRTKHSLEQCPTWRTVALAYQRRPGYRQEWRP